MRMGVPAAFLTLLTLAACSRGPKPPAAARCDTAGT